MCDKIWMLAFRVIYYCPPAGEMNGSQCKGPTKVVCVHSCVCVCSMFMHMQLRKND